MLSMTKANARVHVFVSGRVQGVFFRVETRHEARKRNITGWVKNTFDGKVEAIFEGPTEEVEALVEFCRKGPPGARVAGVDVQWQEYIGEFTGFNIRRSNII